MVQIRCAVLRCLLWPAFLAAFVPESYASTGLWSTCNPNKKTLTSPVDTEILIGWTRMIENQTSYAIICVSSQRWRSPMQKNLFTCTQNHLFFLVSCKLTPNHHTNVPPIIEDIVLHETLMLYNWNPKNPLDATKMSHKKTFQKWEFCKHELNFKILVHKHYFKHSNKLLILVEGGSNLYSSMTAEVKVKFIGMSDICINSSTSRNVSTASNLTMTITK